MATAALLGTTTTRVTFCFIFFFFSSRRRHTRFDCDWSSDVCSSDLQGVEDIGVSVRMTADQVTAAAQLLDVGGREERAGPEQVGHDEEVPAPAAREIGRASCRERV